MKKNISEMGKILLKRPSDPNYTLERFQKQFPIPEYEKIVFMDEEKEKEWEQLEDSHKNFIMGNLRETASKMQSKIAIDMLCHIINDMNERIKKLEHR